MESSVWPCNGGRANCCCQPSPSKGGDRSLERDDPPRALLTLREVSSLTAARELKHQFALVDGVLYRVEKDKMLWSLFSTIR